MSLDSASNFIYSRFNANWNENDAKILWPNQNIDKPTDKSPWLRIVVQPAEAFTASLGGANGPFYRYPGVIIGQIFTQAGVGTGLAQQLADSFAGIFRGASFNGVQCREASYTVVGEMDGWYQVNVIVSFYFDNQHV